MREFIEYRGYNIGIQIIFAGDGKWSNSVTFDGGDERPPIPGTSFVPASDSQAEAKASCLGRAKAVIDQLLGAA